jgi:hypothetical protein
LPLHHLVAVIPAWFHLTGVTGTELLGTACIALENAVGEIRADLRVRDCSGTVCVQEQVPGTRFPRTCHERHIQSHEHFCIGFNAGHGIVSSDHAAVWWGLLKHFLELQRVAERTKRWPPRQEMAHGDAGPHQIAAMEAAAELGIADQYMRMLEGEQAWFVDGSLIVDPAEGLAKTGIPCPLGCREYGKAVPMVSCWHNAAVIRLVTEERLRREKVDEYYQFVRLCRESCCGTMLDCPLGQAPATKVATQMRNT